MRYLLELEETDNYIFAFEEYQKQYSVDKDFQVWKHYYFFLWYIIVEDFPLGLASFISENDITKELIDVAAFGMNKFKNDPEALFVLGYTISLFPYYFGDYIEWEEKANRMLERATNILSRYIIYQLAYLGASSENQELYHQVCTNAASEVVARFSGAGLYNKYFKDVLYRV